MGKAANLRQPDRFIGDEAVGQHHLHGGAVGEPPFRLADQGDHLGQLRGADRAGGAGAVYQHGLALGIAGEAEVDVIGAGDHEIAAFHLDHGRAAGGGFGVGAVGLAGAQPFGRREQDRCLVLRQEPADGDRTPVGRIRRAFDGKIDLHGTPPGWQLCGLGRGASRAAVPGRGNRGRGKSAAHCGTGSGVFGINGLAVWIYVAFILSFPSAPAVAPASPALAAMARRIRGWTGAGGRRAGLAGPVGQGARP